MAFEDELRDLINRHSRENESDTPDFILAQYLEGCLALFGATMKVRNAWNNEPVVKVTVE